MEKLYKAFLQESQEFLKQEIERLSYEFDPKKDYTENDLLNLFYGERHKDLIGAQIWNQLVTKTLTKRWGSLNPPNQQGINIAYLDLLKLKSSRKGTLPNFNTKDLEHLFELIKKIDKFSLHYCSQKITFLQPQYGMINIGDNEATLIIRIDDTYLKCETFFSASLATFTHLLRNICNPKGGILSRIILSRTLLEVSIHNLFIIRKLHGIVYRIRNKEIAKSIKELNLFANQFSKGMFGSKSPQIEDNSPIPYNIMSCFECLKKKPVEHITYEYTINLYDHLCDFAHPNYLMRNMLMDIEAARGDYFSYELLIDKSFEGRIKGGEFFECLIESIKSSIFIIKQASKEKEQIRIILNEKAKKYKKVYNEFSFNDVTGTSKPKL